MKKLVGLWLLVAFHFTAFSQVDSSYVYRTGTPYGTLDIRLAKSSTQYYYLQPDRTHSFRESSPGVKTNSYVDMTSWDSSPYSQGNMREKIGGSDVFVMNYRLLFPLSYNTTYSPGYPLIVMMHGAGERGNCWTNTCYHADRTWNPWSNTPPAPTVATSRLLNNDHNLLHGGQVHLNSRNIAGGRLPNDPALSARAFPGFVLFPQNMNGWDGASIHDAIRLIRLVASKYNIDENRIYIHGLSNGANAVYEAMKRAPWLFAAALTMSAPSDGNIILNNLRADVAHIPLWTFQGGMDTAPTPARTNEYVKKFREAGQIVRYTLYPNLGHGTWNNAYNEPDFFTWILSKNKSNLHSFAGSTAICLTNGQGVKLELAAGFRAYQWEKNGVIISGATSNTYTATSTGTYRARFSRKANPGIYDWNQWSASVNVTQQNPAPAQIVQTGTVLLRDLNYFNDAKLNAAGKFDHYYWYKNGVLVDMPGNLDDTTKYATLRSGDCSAGPCPGNGTYTLVVAGYDNCPSPASQPKYVYFSDQAPINITAPSNLAGSIPAPSSIRLTWTDASWNENGFEVWRRQVTGTTYSKWEMRMLTGANVNTYTDTGNPNSTYHYKIRAVSNSGRSDYNPAGNAFITISTGGDTQIPTTPLSLTAAQVGIGAIKLTWQPSTDNSGIRQYRIYYGSQTVLTNSTQTNYTLTNLGINTVYSFTVRAEDLAGNLSAVSNTASANTYVSGLYYEHSTGAWNSLNSINWNTYEFSGKVTTFTLAPRTQEDFFNFKFDGYLYINTGGSYQFQAISSDGSRIDLNGVTIVNNDGIHGTITITSAPQSLGAGPHRITVKYFEYDESHVLNIRYAGPDTGGAWVSIPTTALKSGNPPATMMAASSASPEAMMVEESPEASVYPNPTTQQDINLQMEKMKDTPVHVKIIDFTGREVYRGEFNAEEVNEGIKIEPLETMNDGIYFIVINQHDKVIRKRISIKNR